MATYKMHRRLTTALFATLGAATLLIAACTTVGPSAPAAISDAMMPKTDAVMKPADTMTSKDAAMPSTTTDTMKKDDAMMPKTDAMTKPADTMMMSGGLPKEVMAAHVTASTPGHGATLAQAPFEIAISFNSALSEASSVVVTRDGMPVTTGPVMLGDGKLSLRVPLTGGIGEGLFVVTYKACSADMMCNDGQFGFTVGAVMPKT